MDPSSSSSPQLAPSPDLFRTMGNGASVLVWISGPDKLCTWFNDSWLKFTGRTLEQELGNGWIDGVHPDDREQCVSTYLRALCNRGTPAKRLIAAGPSSS